ncbi:MAG: protein kinase [Hyphomicrobiaceae bacterium]
MTNVLALSAGTELAGDFRIERVLGAGGFGITYLAEEIVLARLVTIKEYFPSDFAARGSGDTAVPRDSDCEADFQWGLDRFIDEAQTLARFDHPNIVKVYRYFRANGTAYMVLHFEEGQSLKAWLKGLGRSPRQRELDTILKPLLEALETIHAADYLHRDIAPDNIIIRRDGSPVLIDFGSARGDIARHSRTVSALVKPGYSPYEQYAENGVRQGPWTDIYAMGATLYHAISGRRPPEAPSRVVKDEMGSAQSVAHAAYRNGFLAAVDRALMLDTNRRPQSIAAWRGELLAPDEPRANWLMRTLRPKSAGGKAASRSKARSSSASPDTMPPPPDVPDGQGGLLDFIERERMKSKAEAGETAPLLEPDAAASGADRDQAEPAAANRCRRGKRTTAERPASAGRPKRATSGRKRSAPKEALPAVRRSPPRPRPMPGSSRRWRSLALKLLIGAGIAGAALATQDQFAGGGSEPKRETNERVFALPALPSFAGVSQIVTGSLFRSPPPASLAGHAGGTTAVAFSANGTSVVTVGADGTMKVWDAAHGGLTRTVSLDDGPATSLALSDRRALTGHRNGAVALWDIDTGERIGRFKRNEANIWALTFAGDSDHFIASSHDWSMAIWDVRTADKPIAVVEAHDNAVQAVAYSPRGPYIATGSADRTVRLWRASDLSLVRTYYGHREYVTALAFSPDGRYLAAAAMDGRIRVWHTSSRSLYRINTQHHGQVSGLAFSPTGETIASTGQDGRVQIWRFRRSRLGTDLVEQGPPVEALAYAPDGRRIAVASSAGKVTFWDTAAVTAAARRGR